MTSSEIKQTYSMFDILERYGLKVNRSGFIRCPFHKEKTASMKIYKDSFHCFGCGESGDIFGFVQRMDNLTFKEAFTSLGGGYVHDFETWLKIYHAKKERQKRLKREQERKNEIDVNNLKITLYRELINDAEPMSDEWAGYVKALELLLYKHEVLHEMR